MGVIRKRGVAYQVDFRLDGKRLRETFKTKREAESFLEAIDRRAMAEKLGFVPEHSLPTNEVTIKDAIRQYYDGFSVSKANVTGEKQIFSELFEYLVNVRQIEYIGQVDLEMMETYQNHLRKRVSASTVNRAFSTIKHFFNKCVDWEYRDISPCMRLKALKENPVERKIWTPEEMETVLVCLQPWAREIVLFYCMTGARPSEVRDLTWGDVDFSQGTISLMCKKNSGTGKRIFPISEPVMEQLVRLKPMMIGKALHQELVFKDDMGKQFSQDRLQKTFKRLREELGMSAQHVLYGLRHSFGTNLSNQDMNMEKVRVLMGHSKITTTQRYMKIKAADLGVELSKKSFTLRLA